MLAKGFVTKLFASTRLTGRSKRLLFLKSHIAVLICEKIRANRPHTAGVNQVGCLPEAPKWCRCEKRFYHNQRQRPVFGQFFPSTPQIPGAMIHAATGEYDMPAVAMVLWATHRL